MNVAIIGSCVTRDLFTHCPSLTNKLNINLYISRSTINSMVMKSPIKYLVDIDFKTSGFDDKRFLWDLDKSYWQRLKQSDPDILIIDLIDERHGIFIFDGCALTVTKSSLPYIKKVQSLIAGHTLTPLSEEWQAQTNISLKNFVDKIINNINYTKCKIIIHRSLYATTYIEDDQLLSFSNHPTLKSINCVEWNRYLNQMYDYLVIALSAYDLVIEEHLIGGGNHLWDLTPFHYDKTYYEHLAEKISQTLFFI